MSFATLGVAVSGMNTARTGLNVVGHNIANSSAPGFARQNALQTNSFLQARGRNHFGVMQIGLGADTTGIRQIRDSFADTAFRDRAGLGGFHTPVADAGLSIERIISELQGPFPMHTIFNDILAALHELSMNQSSIEVRGNFISTALTFVGTVNGVHHQLQELQQNKNAQVIETTNRVNGLLEEIAHWNSRIIREEILGDNANDFRDRRNLALDELSSLMNITYRENTRGEIIIQSEGHDLLGAGNFVNRMGFKQAGPQSHLVIPVFTNLTDIIPYGTNPTTFTYVFDFNTEISTERGNAAGHLKGLLLARGMSWDINAHSYEHLQSLDPVLDASEYNRLRFDLEQALIPRTMAMLDTLVNHVITKINDAVAPQNRNDLAGVPFDMNGDQRFIPVFVRGDDLFQMERYTYDPATGLWSFNAEDPTQWRSLYTMGNLRVNPALLQSGSQNPDGTWTGGWNLLALSLSGDEDDTTLVQELITRWQEDGIHLPGVEHPATINDSYRTIAAVVGNHTEHALGVAMAASTEMQFIDTRRQAIMGVSIDEEMGFMLTFQHAYHANSRVVNLVDSMLDTLINGLRR